MTFVASVSSIVVVSAGSVSSTVVSTASSASSSVVCPKSARSWETPSGSASMLAIERGFVLLLELAVSAPESPVPVVAESPCPRPMWYSAALIAPSISILASSGTSVPREYSEASSDCHPSNGR